MIRLIYPVIGFILSFLATLPIILFGFTTLPFIFIVIITLISSFIGMINKDKVRKPLFWVFLLLIVLAIAEYYTGIIGFFNL